MARLTCLSAAMAMFCFGLGVAPVHAATTRWVNMEETVPIPPGNGCEHAGYITIQSAVNDALPGDTIRVCRGTYEEQVTIPVGKDNLTLHSVSHWHAIIKAPVVMLDVKATSAYQLLRT